MLCSPFGLYTLESTMETEAGSLDLWEILLMSFSLFLSFSILIFSFHACKIDWSADLTAPIY